MSDRYGGVIHYRCAFDANCVNPDWTEPYGDMLKRVRGWAEKVLDFPPNALKCKKFFLGGGFRDECSPRTSLETLLRNYNEQGMPPSYWGCRLSHPCGEFSHRTWTTDITITTRNAREFRIVLVNSHAISGYLGEEPPLPTPSAPGIVQSLVTSRHWRCTSGAELLNGRPIVAYLGRVDLVKLALVDERRGCPIIYVSCATDTGFPLVDVENLAKVLSGTAVVYVAQNAEVDREFDYLIGKDFSTWNGGIRIYQPRVNLEVSADARRHRFFTPPRILELGSDEVSLQIVRACCRRAPVIISSDVVSIDDIASVGRRRRLRELAGSQAPADRAELEELIAAVDEDNTQLRKELEAERFLREMETEEGADTIAQLRFDYEQYRQNTQSLYTRIRDLERRSETLKNLDRLPEDLEETLRIICDLHADKIECLEDALDTARESTFENIELAWRLIWSLASVLYPMLFNDDEIFSDAEFGNKTGFSLAMSEGAQTQRDNKLMRLRKKSYRGQEIDITPHVGWGTGNNCLRVHFAVDHVSKKLIIGHCGNHLDNWTTKKRK